MNSYLKYISIFLVIFSIANCRIDLKQIPTIEKEIHNSPKTNYTVEIDNFIFLGQNKELIEPGLRYAFLLSLRNHNYFSEINYYNNPDVSKKYPSQYQIDIKIISDYYQKKYWAFAWPVFLPFPVFWPFQNKYAKYSFTLEYFIKNKDKIFKHGFCVKSESIELFIYGFYRRRIIENMIKNVHTEGIKDCSLKIIKSFQQL